MISLIFDDGDKIKNIDICIDDCQRLIYKHEEVIEIKKALNLLTRDINKNIKTGKEFILTELKNHNYHFLNGLLELSDRNANNLIDLFIEFNTKIIKIESDIKETQDEWADLLNQLDDEEIQKDEE